MLYYIGKFLTSRNIFMAHGSLISCLIYNERFTSHDVISARQIFDLLNMFLAQKYLILNFPHIFIDSNRCLLSHREVHI